MWPCTLQCPKYPIYVICVTSVSKSQISLFFNLRPTVSELQVILRLVHRMTPNDLERHKFKGTPYIHSVSIPFRFALWLSIFELHVILRQVHRIIPKWPWTLQGHGYPKCVLLDSRSPKISPHFSLHDQSFSRHKVVDNRKCTEWRQYDLDT